MSPRRIWDFPPPSLASECAPLPPSKGGGGAHSPAGEGWGSPNSDDWRKSFALCLLCVSPLWREHVTETTDATTKYVHIKRGRGTLAGEKGVGRVPIPTRGIHCGTLYMYVLCGVASVVSVTCTYFVDATLLCGCNITDNL
jgi:hypothetical protein